MNFSELIENYRDLILEQATKYGAKNVRIFGSVARGDSKPNSDIDILVKWDPQSSLLDHIALVQELQDILPCHVDVVSEKALHWYVRDKVLKEAVSL